MFSSSKVVVAELRKAEVLLRVLAVRVKSRWIPSAMNRFLDALSRTWDEGHGRATDVFLMSIQDPYGLNHVTFKDTKLRETLVARKLYLDTQVQDGWGDGVARLRNPKIDILPLLERKR